MRPLGIISLLMFVSVASAGASPTRSGECAALSAGPAGTLSTILAAAPPVTRGLLETEGFPPRWLSGTAWTGALGWTHIIADVFIWLSYMAIPVIIGLYMLRRRDVPFPAVGWLFVAFIFLCGTGHLIDAVMFWWPGYRVLGLVKALTAAVSVATVVALVPVLPRALALPGMAKLNARLAGEVDARRKVEEDLKRTVQVWSEANRELAFQKFALDQAALVAITDARGRITYVNHKFCQISKYTREELLGQDHRIINSGRHPKSFFTEMYATIGKGEVWHGEICNRAKDGAEYWVDTTIVPFRNVDGKVTRYIAIRTDTTERKCAEEQLERALSWKEQSLQRERTLLRELEHRVRNNLAGLLGLTSIYERSERSVSEVASALRGKIRAMLHVHELMSPDPSAPIPLGILVRKLAEQCTEAGRLPAVAIGGPAISLRPKHAGAMAMIVQELFTNSAKYGALSQPGGSISIAWGVEHRDGQDWLELNWDERMREPAVAPEAEGVGLRLIRGLCEMELRGSVKFSYGRAGFRCLIHARLGGESMADGAPSRNTEPKNEHVHATEVLDHAEALAGARAPAGAGG